MAEKIKKCPICKKDVVQEFRPFCSKRCKDVDLNRWLSNSYIIPGEEMLRNSNDQKNDHDNEYIL
jgi:endogenous inhibitor of DNA gyrase (YacG/DUF329 family)